MNRRLHPLTLHGTVLGTLPAYRILSVAVYPRPDRDNQTNSDASDRSSEITLRDTSVPIATQVLPNLPTIVRTLPETVGASDSRIGVTAT
jgi:hypothetical protein